MREIDRPGELRIEEIRPAGEPEWDALWAACEYATYFHSREWAEIWEEYSEGRIRPDPRLVTFSDRSQALLPLSLERAGRWGARSGHRSSPAGTYGGWLSSDRLDERHAVLLSRYLLELPGLVWRVNPFDAVGADVSSHAGRPDHTRALELGAGFAPLRTGWSKGHRSAARKALREGVSISVATGLEGWRSYFDLYRAALGRWGEAATSCYGWKLFERLHARHSAHVRLWLASRGDELLAGAVVFSAKEHVVYWHGSSLPDRERLRPVHLLLHEIVRAACSEGHAVFDFNPSGGHPGVDAFKKGFGAPRRPSPVIRTPGASVWDRLRSLARPGTRA